MLESDKQKSITKNLVSNKVCRNCKYYETTNMSWCDIRADQPKYKTCHLWKQGYEIGQANLVSPKWMVKNSSKL
jgi:hypothetical protein